MSTVTIISPLPGTFYRASAPDKPPFVEQGQSVTADSVIGLIEVMKQFNEITADQTGDNIQFLVENGAMVEAGQTLATIESR